MVEGETAAKKLKTGDAASLQLLLDKHEMMEPSASTEKSVRLTDLEVRLFAILRGAAEKSGKDTVLRVAGGWVRDKLLGRDSYDIDVALDNTSGAAFAEVVNEYLTEQGMETHSIGVIEANPEQSKHLETAKVLILGMWVDFTNLRTETYQSDSRIPTIAFGSAEEDAYRRDFTVNSLFYNLNTNQVEDLTGRGLSDLMTHHVIRTPLEPRATFLDDPLRLLRAIRFAARFDFELHGDIVAAARDPELVQALLVKVSRERVGIELEGMLSGKNARPQLALDLVSSLGLADTVFLRPAELGPVHREEEKGEQGQADWAETWDAAGMTAVRALAVRLIRRSAGGSSDSEASLPPISEPEALSKSAAYRRPLPTSRLHFLGSMLLPWAGAYYLTGKKRQDVAAYIVRESLKFRNKDAADVAGALNLCHRFRVLAAKGREASRVEVGLLLKEAQDLWRLALELACVWDLCKVARPGSTTAGGDDGEAWAGVEARYDAAAQHVQDLGLEECWKLKPLLNGQAVIKVVGVPQGPLMAKAMHEQYRWQLEKPEGEEALLVQHLKAWLADAITTAEQEPARVGGGAKKKG